MLAPASALALRAPQPIGFTAPARAGTAAMMAKPKKDVLELEGVVLEALPSATFRVKLDDTEQVRLPCTFDQAGQPSGWKMQRAPLMYAVV